MKRNYKNIDISIIVPVYNVEKYIEKCILSIINQTFNNFELILINDGSKDKSGEICDYYKKKDNRITVIHKSNTGVSNSRNEGLKIAKGKYIMFIDPDDYVEKDICLYLYNLISKNETDIVICSYKELINNKITEKSYSGELSTIKKDIALELFFSNQSPIAPTYMWNKIFRRELFDSIKFLEQIHFMEDSIMNINLILNTDKDILFFDYPLYFYNNRLGSAVNGFNKKRMTAFDAVEYIHNISKNISHKYYKMYIPIYTKVCLDIIHRIISNNFDRYENEYINISKKINSFYLYNINSKKIKIKIKLHLTILKISPILYKNIIYILLKMKKRCKI